MDWDEYIKWGKEAVVWGSEYRKNLRNYPVRSQSKPGETFNSIPPNPPENPESIEQIFDDFKKIILPGVTHWQHPRFFAYFPANAAPASVFAEILTNTMGLQCMLWQTSPSATELEEKVIEWLRISLNIPKGFGGIIQDTASSATLTAILTMREKALNWKGNKVGLSGQGKLRIYASTENTVLWIKQSGSLALAKII